MLARADAIAQRYHVRPSALLRGSLADWQIDEAAAVVGSQRERRAADAAPAPAEQPRSAPAKMQLIGGMPVVTGIVERA